MSRFAPVAPPQVLRRMKEIGDFCLGGYHLLLAHDVAARPDEYKGLFNGMCTIIMDNSLIELGYPVGGDILFKAVKALQIDVQCAVLPDVPHDADKTVELSQVCANDYLHIAPAYMAVPQGHTLEEYTECARRLAEIDGVMHWGVPRSVVEMLGTRKYLVQELRQLKTKGVRNWSNIHLLGFSDNIEDDIECAKMHAVVGIDSAAPIRMGQNKQLIARHTQGDQAGPRGDFWERPCNSIEPETLANLFLIRNWMQTSSFHS